MSKNIICINCHKKIISPKSRYQSYCNNCYNLLKGGRKTMENTENTENTEHTENDLEQNSDECV